MYNYTMMQKYTSQSGLILEYYKQRPGQDIPHSEAVDWATDEWQKLTGKILRDPDRAIRKMAQEGQLVKVAKGVYRYDPDFVQKRALEDFTPEQKKQILERDNYRCVVCGRGVAEGVELQIDHIKPKDFGGKATLENGQTLCAQHNFLKKNYSQTETAKRLFVRLHKSASDLDDKNLVDFTKEVLDLYEKYDIDSHIN